jgi:predicted nucleic acid-binding protein
MTKYLVDTNILLRVAEPHSRQHPSAEAAVAKLLLDEHRLFLAPQGVAEFWVAASRPADVNGLGWSFEAVDIEVARLLKQFPLLRETPQLFAEWRRLVVQNRVIGKQAHDARLAAIMHTNRLTHILTFNVNNFRAYGVTVVSPDDVLASIDPAPGSQ